MFFIKRKRLFPTLFFLTLTLNLFGQISITLPLEKAVYQRSSSNTANIPISGTYSISPITSIQAQLRLVSNNSIVVPWTIIDANPVGNHFQGQLSNVIAGWYVLELRTVKSGSVVETTQLNTIGVGDVFLIAGQSNAQGVDDITITPLPQTSNQVVTHNFFDACSTQFPVFPNFSYLNPNTYPSMQGFKAWLYGKLGDNLVSSQGVPVAFFNAGAGGSSVKNWNESSYGLPTLHPYYAANYCLLPDSSAINSNNLTGIGSPYITFKNTLNYYNSIYGIRAILWHQGESESNVGHMTSYSDYYNNLDSLVQKSRTDFNSQIPWVISRVSYQNGNTNLNVINAQTAYGNLNVNKIFQGPNTDLMNSTFRVADNVHFNTAGLSEAANTWSTALNSNFYTNAAPIPAQTQPALTYVVNGNNLSVSAPSGYATYKWIRTDINGNNFSAPAHSTNQSITVNSGTYRCYVRDSFGRFQITHEVNVTSYLNSINNNINCSTSYLSDLKPLSKINGYGPIEFDKSNGNQLDGDGIALSIDGTSYLKGIGMHSQSSIEYKIVKAPSPYTLYFIAKIGIDDEVGSGGSAIFKVYGDNNLLFTSGVKTGSSPVESISVDINNYSVIKLEVTDAGDGITNDHADWADAKFTCDDVPPTAPPNFTLGQKTRKCLSFSWGNSTDNVSVTGYKIFKNNKLIATVASNINNYQFEGLRVDTLYYIKVIAYDLSGNISDSSGTSTRPYSFVPFTYSNRNLCPGEVAFPIIETSFINFKYNSGPGGNLNTATGNFSSNNTGTHNIKYFYTVGNCSDSGSVNIDVYALPTITPTFTIDKTNIKQGTSINLVAQGCHPNYKYFWNDNTLLITQTRNLSPIDTTVYNVKCKNTGSNSNNIVGCAGSSSPSIKVNVTPLCSSNLQLISTVNDISLTGISPIVNSSNTIQASNKIFTNTIVNYKAGNSILLQPGFVANNGTSFVAQIEGCTN